VSLTFLKYNCGPSPEQMNTCLYYSIIPYRRRPHCACSASRDLARDIPAPPPPSPPPSVTPHHHRRAPTPSIVAPPARGRCACRSDGGPWQRSSSVPSPSLSRLLPSASLHRRRWARVQRRKARWGQTLTPPFASSRRHLHSPSAPR
jgi:hypothetical protein